MKRRQFLKDAAGFSVGYTGAFMERNTLASSSESLVHPKGNSLESQSKNLGPASGSAKTDLVEKLAGEWLISIDPKGSGLGAQWYARPAPDARKTTVPSIIQQVYPSYHGLAWFWREFIVPPNPYEHGRFLLRFSSVDYLADVWVNGSHVGRHEGANAPFLLDITDVVKPKVPNLLSLRILNPTNKPIDGIVLAQTPHGNKRIPFLNGSTFNFGGIVGPVEDLYVKPDWKTGAIQIQAAVRNALPKTVGAHVRLSVIAAGRGEVLQARDLHSELSFGKTLIEGQLQVANPRLWELKDPYLYQVAVRVAPEAVSNDHECSVHCGFRDFRVVNGYFQLNGKRLFLRSTHTGNHCPIGQILPPPQSPDLLRLDIVNAKNSGFNTIRFISGFGPVPYQLDLCDEIGMLVYQEHMAAWLLQNSPKMKERFDFSVRDMILRDRNHPSTVIWGLLNETEDGPVFDHAVESLELVRSLDDSRLVLLGSGRFDGRLNIGSLSNPGSSQWEFQWGREGLGEPVVAMKYPSGLGVGDFHFYPGVPPTPQADHFLRALGENSRPVFLSEYGIGSVMDVVHDMRMYEQFGADPELEDYVLMRSMAEKLLKDWKRFGLEGVYPFPENMLADSQRLMGRHRLHGFDLIRSNPKLCGFNLTGMLDHAMTGEGVWRFWRDWKPGVMDDMRDGWAPLRWCLFVEPLHTYVGRPLRIEAVLANEDVLKPGEYPVGFRIHDLQRVVWERRTSARIPQPTAGQYGPLAVPVLSEEVRLDAPAGVYKFEASMEAGGSPAGGPLEFYLSDPPPKLRQSVTIWGLDDKTEKWLDARGVKCDQFGTRMPSRREIILVGDISAKGAQLPEWKELALRAARGSVIVFLSHFAFKSGADSVRWLPLEKKGRCYEFNDGLYHKECVANAHPIFEGLPGKGILNWYFYGPVWPHYLFDGQETPDEVVAAAFAAGYPTPGGYASGVLLGWYQFGEGRFILNTFPLLENYDTHPAAGRLLINIINYAGQFVAQPLAPVPASFDSQLKAIGYFE